MTDGIIQQVFKKYTDMLGFIPNDYEKIQQELIEKIKEETQLADTGYVIRVKKLIGDSQNV